MHKLLVKSSYTVKKQGCLSWQLFQFLTDSHSQKPWDSYVASKNESHLGTRNTGSRISLVFGDFNRLMHSRGRNQYSRDLEFLLSLSRPASFERWTPQTSRGYLPPQEQAPRFPHGRFKTSRSSRYPQYGGISGRVYQKWQKWRHIP